MRLLKILAVTFLAPFIIIALFLMMFVLACDEAVAELLADDKVGY